ncbi:MAG: sodium:solute symporter, partial [Pseudomonadota bacterium]
MLSANLIITIAIAYVGLLFVLAWRVDRAPAAARARWLSSPLIYTLSLSVYCTAWTFYGAVGSAARNGLEFAAIYLGPTLVFVGWWWVLRKLVMISRSYRITSIADMISSRYGKSSALGVIVTLAGIVATTPYIALQLQSVALSYGAITGAADNGDWPIAFWITVGMAAFTILFGTRSLDERERHYGVVAAIALEAVVKLAALLAVGLFATLQLSEGDLSNLWTNLAGRIDAASTVGPPAEASEALHLAQIVGPRWMTLLLLSAAAIICLPRVFHVAVVENTNERHLATASWMFPLYLLLTSVFVAPIAAAGLAAQPDANPDLLVLTLPLDAGAEALAVLAFIGGFSSATSMVIVSAIALSTMASNHIVAPLALGALARFGRERGGDVRAVLLTSRRVAIAAILGLGYLYYVFATGSVGLASIGLIAFCGVAQFLPALLAGLFWREATRFGAVAGLLSGFAVWSYALFLPSFDGAFLISAETIAEGPWGIAALRPYALFGVRIDDPLVHATLWSLGANVSALVIGSLVSAQSPLERLQATLFVDVFRSETRRAPNLVRRSAASHDLYVLGQRILGERTAQALFRDEVVHRDHRAARDPTHHRVGRGRP